MELWIRTQDKEELVCVKTFELRQNNSFYGLCNDKYYYLGRYRTKNRVLEVLDEIQNILMPKLFIKTKPIETIQDAVQTMVKQSENYYIEQFDTFVYQMPKE